MSRLVANIDTGIDSPGDFQTRACLGATPQIFQDTGSAPVHLQRLPVDFPDVRSTIISFQCGIILLLLFLRFSQNVGGRCHQRVAPGPSISLQQRLQPPFELRNRFHIFLHANYHTDASLDGQTRQDGPRSNEH